jgi:protein-S-isoprenylcysteine O-methyltransferase Ste14
MLRSPHDLTALPLADALVSALEFRRCRWYFPQTVPSWTSGGVGAKTADGASVAASSCAGCDAVGRKSTSTELGETETKRLLPPVYFLIAILLGVALHFALPLRIVIPLPWSLLGVWPLLLGIILNVLADRSLKRHETAVKPFEPSRALVTDGVYRVSRHPMYLGMVLILAGIAVLLGSLTPWFILLLLAVVLDARFIRIEESMLEETFGEAYRAYRKRARRWI